MNLTTSNIDNRLLLAHCCYADYAIKYLEKQNIGDLQQASCYMNKMRQLYFSMEALNQFTPAAELSPSTVLTGLSGNIGDTVAIYVNGVNISGTVTQTGSDTLLGVSVMAAINTYTGNYRATFDDNPFTLYSNTTGTIENGYDVTFVITGSISATPTTLSGGQDQWCLDDIKAELILEKINELCGCPCGDCDGSILDDTLPRYVN